MRKTSLLIAALLMAALLSLAGRAKGGGKGDCSALWWEAVLTAASDGLHIVRG
ncbi:MAG: hypothetical protein IIA41_14270 [SAR324 cluster bacterium]|nr:hypothetical protein [SAR324 cluster bacterium]